MDFGVRLTTLPLWAPIWLVALIVLTDLVFLRLPVQEVQVASATVQRAGRDEVCELTLKLADGRYEQKSVDKAVCGRVRPNQPLALSQTLLLHRWINLRSHDQSSVSWLVDNRLLIDWGYVLLAVLLPIGFAAKRQHRLQMALYFLLAFEIFGLVYLAVSLASDI